MTRALVLLACAAAAAGARFADYAGGRMPQYGEYEGAAERAAHADDYLGHSADASAPLDYKYEEERPSKTDKPSQHVDDADVWRKVRRKQRGLQRSAGHEDLDALGQQDEDEDVAPRSRPARAHAHAKRRPRLHDADEPPAPRRRSPNYSRDRKIEVSDTSVLDSDDFADDKNKVFDDEVSFGGRDTTRRVIRRKPRDRSMKFDEDSVHDDELLVADRRLKGDSDREPEYSAPEGERWRAGDERGQRERYRPAPGANDDAAPRATKHRQKMYEDYNDYYDMKRVQNIKQKLPALLRRSSTVKSPPGIGSPRGSELIQEWLNRRLGAGPPAPTTSDVADIETDSGEIIDIVASKEIRNENATSEVTEHTSVADVTRITTTSHSTSPDSTNATRELSLAEKSRLSILKKAQRKDGVKEVPTKKPPVLLQVTQKLATVVMVEPPESRRPWVPAHVLTADSPQRLDRVKKLMRHKLVAQAKSIQDLTDNWDEMVCDYIDVGLLDGGAAPLASGLGLVLLLLFI